MTLNKILLLVLIAAVFLTIGVFIINPDNREVLTQPLHLYGLSFSVMKGGVFALILAAILPSAYFSWRYTQAMGKVRLEKRKQEGADSGLKKWEQALALYSHGQFSAALKLVEDKQGPGHLALKARILLASEQLDEAYSLLSRAYEETSHVELGYLLVETMERSQRNPMEILRSLVRLDPKNALIARHKLLEHYDRLKMWEECLTILDDLGKAGEKVDPSLQAAYRYEELLTRKDLPPKKYLDALQQLVKAQPDFVPAALALGDALIQQDALQKAFRLYERSFERTRNPVFLSKIEQFYLDQARPEDAIQIYRELMVRVNQPMIRFQLGKLYFKLEMTDECLEVLEPLGGSLGHIPGYLNYLMQAKARRGRKDDALNDARALARNRGFAGEDYICTSCRTPYKQWQARCGTCRQWNHITLEASLVTNESLAINPIHY